MLRVGPLSTRIAGELVMSRLYIKKIGATARFLLSIQQNPLIKKTRRTRTCLWPPASRLPLGPLDFRDWTFRDWAAGTARGGLRNDVRRPHWRTGASRRRGHPRAGDLARGGGYRTSGRSPRRRHPD